MQFIRVLILNLQCLNSWFSVVQWIPVVCYTHQFSASSIHPMYCACLARESYKISKWEFIILGRKASCACTMYMDDASNSLLFQLWVFARRFFPRRIFVNVSSSSCMHICVFVHLFVRMFVRWSVYVLLLSFPRSVYFYRCKINSANEDIYGMFRFWYSEANLVQYTYNFAKMFDAIQIFNKVSAQITTHIR